MFDFLAGFVMGERSAARAASMARAAAGSASAATTGEIHDINVRIGRLLLVIEAMWTLLREHGHTDEELVARIREVDAADGSIDGIRTLRPVPCPACDSMVEAGRATCPFCGHPFEPPSPFDGV